MARTIRSSRGHMIQIDQDAKVPGCHCYRVLEGGMYGDDELVEVYHIHRPGVAEVAFRAPYIAGQE